MSEQEKTGGPTSIAQSARARLLDLARRCETEEPSFDLECAIATAVGFYHPDPEWARPRSATPCYCRSIDAAVTLVPESFKNFWLVGDESDVAKMFGRVGYEWIGNGRTPALSLCAAALRAHAEIGKAEEQEASARASATSGASK